MADSLSNTNFKSTKRMTLTLEYELPDGTKRCSAVKCYDLMAGAALIAGWENDLAQNPAAKTAA